MLASAALLWLAPIHVDTAAASCAEMQRRSPYAFTGFVLSTQSRGRVAAVRTDAGATVKVLGTTASRWAVTSVDRTYEVGGRYEFHPINAAPPYEDNACTYTRLLSADATPSPPMSGSEPSVNSPAPAVLAASALTVLGIAGGLAARRRRRSQRRLP